MQDNRGGSVAVELLLLIVDKIKNVLAQLKTLVDQVSKTKSWNMINILNFYQMYNVDDF